MAKEMEHYRQLLRRYLDNTCTPQEVEAVWQFLQQEKGARLLLEEIQAEFDMALEEPVPAMPATTSKKLQRRLLERISPAPKPISFGKWAWRLAAAALLLFVLGAGSWYLLFRQPPAPTTRVTGPIPASPTLPGRNKAYITLADGRQMLLDSAARDQAIEQGNASITQLDGNQVVYNSDSSLPPPDSKLAFNTLTVPRGGHPITLMLSDGTRIWVNTASSLRYPTAFAAGERRVELDGEAYFEVQHHSTDPFIVRTGHAEVQVLGTHFNVSAYQEEEQEEVVLVKGSVKVNMKSEKSNGKNNPDDAKSVSPFTFDVSRILRPGQLAAINPATSQLSVTAVNTDLYTSWTKGYLLLKHTPWDKLIRKLGRHYDVSIHTDLPAFREETVSGRLDLQANLEDMMNLICTGTPFTYQPKERKLLHRP